MSSPADAVSRPSLAPGQPVGDKFRLERLLGEGGIGVVYSAFHLELQERVALKFLRTEAMSNPDIVERFAREARAAVRLKSEHVARVLDVGRHGDVPFMVMELLEGRDLHHLIRQSGPLPITEAAELFIQACEALTEAHARGIVHRDVKPENLFVVERGDFRTLKVLDFGISKVALSGHVSEVDLSSNRTTAIMGSPYYMSPEQLRSTRDVDLRSDVWSLGASLFEALSGRHAFDEERQFTELVFDIAEKPHRRLRDFAPHIPEELEAIVDRCLAKSPAQRFQTAAELAVALLPFARVRARGVVERALSTAKAASLDVGLEMPPTIPPSGTLPSLPAGPPSYPSVPRASSTGFGPVTTAHELDPARSGAFVPVPASARAPDDGRKRATRLVLAALGLLVVGAAVFLLRPRATSDPAPPSEPVGIASAAPTPDRPSASAAPPAPSAAPPAAASTREEGAASAVGASTPAPRPPPRAARPPRPAEPSRKPDLEIRTER